jgi:hypothetical protein
MREGRGRRAGKVRFSKTTLADAERRRPSAIPLFAAASFIIVMAAIVFAGRLPFAILALYLALRSLRPCEARFRPSCGQVTLSAALIPPKLGSSLQGRRRASVMSALSFAMKSSSASKTDRLRLARQH